MGYQNDIYLPYTNITTATTTVVRTGSGRLARIVVNGGTLTGAITVYDNTAGSGTLIATIAANQEAGDYYEYNCQFRTGLTIVTAAAVNLTVMADVGEAGEA